MSSVESRTTAIKEAATLTPPLTPPMESKALKSDVPIDLNIPDNYVSWTLKNQKERPPIGWNNWWKELNYLSLTILTVTPAIAIWGAFHVPLMWQTAAFSVLYYFFTGLGTCVRLSRLGICFTKYEQVLPLVTTGCGRTAHTTRLSLSNTSSRSQAPVL